MPRIRSIKPAFCTSYDIVCLSIPCRLHFAMLWTYADDEGRGLDDPDIIKGQLWPKDKSVTPGLIDQWQDELARNGRLVRYRVDGKQIFQIDKFTTHQKPNRRVESGFPGPEGAEQVQSSADKLFEHNHAAPVVVVVGGDVDGEPAASDASEEAVVGNPVTSIRQAVFPSSGRAP
jgi:hypothetical protein